MRRYELSDLSHQIAVTLTFLPKQVSRGANLTGEQAVREATDRILHILSRAAIFVPDDLREYGAMGGVAVTHGEFGVTEPWPFEPGCKPPVKILPPGERG